MKVSVFGDVSLVPACVFWDKGDSAPVVVNGVRVPGLVPLLDGHYLFNTLEPLWGTDTLDIGKAIRVVTDDGRVLSDTRSSVLDGARTSCPHYSRKWYFTLCFASKALRAKPDLLNLSCPCHQLYQSDNEVPNISLMHPHAAELIRRNATSAEIYSQTTGGVALWRFPLVNGGFFEQVDDFHKGSTIEIVLMSVDVDGTRTVVRSCTEHGDG